MAEEKQRVGFIGVGVMGRGMVKNLLKAGFPVTIYARDPQKVEEVIQAGAVLAGSSREVAEKSDIVITMVPDSPQVLEVILGDNGVLEGARPGTIIADMSTINPTTSRTIFNVCATKGVDFLDAPVSGGSVGADTGTLTIMAGGKKEAFDRTVPVFRGMGREDAIYYIGESGSGEVVKIANNILSAIITVANAQALLMGVKAGVDPAMILEVVSKSSGGNWQLSNAFVRNVFTGAFKPGFFTELMRKDVGLAIQLGQEAGVEMTMAEEAVKFYDEAIAAGFGRDDYTSIIRPIEQKVGVEARIPAK